MKQDRFSDIRKCINESHYSILKYLDTNPNKSYTDLLEFLFNVRRGNALMAYYSRVLKKAQLISYGKIRKRYIITRKGKEVLKLMEMFLVKYMSEDNNKLCPITKDGNHKIKKICSSCCNLVHDEGDKDD